MTLPSLRILSSQRLIETIVYWTSLTNPWSLSQQWQSDIFRSSLTCLVAPSPCAHDGLTRFGSRSGRSIPGALASVRLVAAAAHCRSWGGDIPIADAIASIERPSMENGSHIIWV